MKTYLIQTVDNHILADIEGQKVYLDTGSPVSLSSKGGVDLLDYRYELKDKFGTVDFQDAIKSIDNDIAVMLGGDILNQLYFSIDLAGKKVSFSREPFEFEGLEVHTDFKMNVPILQVEIGEDLVPAFVDSGSNLSYVAVEMTKNQVPLGRQVDYFFSNEKLKTEMFRMPVKISGQNFDINFGNLPPELEDKIMSKLAVKAILGNDLFRAFAVFFDYKGGKIKLRKF